MRVTCSSTLIVLRRSSYYESGAECSPRRVCCDKRRGGRGRQCPIGKYSEAGWACAGEVGDFRAGTRFQCGQYILNLGDNRCRGGFEIVTHPMHEGE